MKRAGLSLAAARLRYILSLVLLCGGILYLVMPIDLIPDILGPIGWVDDISALALSSAYAGYSYYALKRARRSAR